MGFFLAVYIKTSYPCKALLGVHGKKKAGVGGQAHEHWKSRTKAIQAKQKSTFNAPAGQKILVYGG